MKRSRKALLVVLILLAMLALVFNFFHLVDEKSGMSQIDIPDASRRASFHLEAKPEQEDVFKLKIRIEGKLEGNAVLRFSPPGRELLVRKVIRGGKVETSYDSDWYARDCELIYEPEPGSSGTLRVYYAFTGLD